MNRFLRAMKTDVMIQWRTKLYIIGIVAGVIVAATFAWLATPEQLPGWTPALLMIVVGGSTLLYVGAMILLEKDQGILSATIVSPMRPSEYLWSKIITLTALATLEAIVMIGGAMLIMSFSEELTVPNIPLLLIGVIALGILYTLTGILLIVRFDKITDFLIPMAGVAVLFQLPFIYFLGWIKHPALLVIPTSAPTVLMQGAFGPLAAWEWFYAIGYTAVLLIGFTIWVQRAFHTHIIMKIG